MVKDMILADDEVRGALHPSIVESICPCGEMLEAGFSGTTVRIVRGKGKKTKNVMVWKCGACGRERREVGDVRVKKEAPITLASKKVGGVAADKKKKNYVHKKPRSDGKPSVSKKPKELGGDFVALSPQLGAKKNKKKRKGGEKSGLMDFLSSLNK